MAINKVIISGGGTGGHIFPAIAIANTIRSKYPNAKILFVGAEGKMEMEKVPKAGYEIVGLPIRGLQRKLTVSNLSFPFKLLSSLVKARKLIKQFKPDVVVGVGGYASAATCRVASSLGIPTVIQEQNSFPGITNKWLAKKASKICVAYDNLDRFFPKDKLVKTGNPIRNEMVNIEGKREKGLAHFQLDATKKTILVIGGSLGARTLNRAMLKDYELLINEGFQLIWQCGKGFYQTLKLENHVVLSNDAISVSDFIFDMDLAYAAADVIISRAGAISVSELCLVAKPVILVPSPNVSEDHQTKNAMALVSENAAVLVKDLMAEVELIPTVIDLMHNPIKCEALKKNIKKLGITDAADRIVIEIEKLV